MKKRIWLPVAVLAAVAVALVILIRSLSGLRIPPNPYTPEDFSYDDDGYLTYTAGTALRGIDISEHQGDIDFSAVKASGVEFVIIRVGYRGYLSGELHQDENAGANYLAAKAAGLKVGAYLFSQAVSPEEAAEEAEFFLEQVKDWELDLWAVYDWERMGGHARTADMDADTLTECTKVFLERVRKAGYAPMVYCNRSQARDLLHMEKLRQYGIWLAMYSDPIDLFPYRMTLWQYTNTGSVPGISGNVDINLWFLPS